MGGVARSLTWHNENEWGRKSRSQYAQGAFLRKAGASYRFGTRVAPSQAFTR